MRGVDRSILAAATLTIGLWGVAGETASAAPKKQTIVVRVIDQDGAPRASASAVACPVIGGQQDCSQAVGMETNAGGYAHLKLDANVRYGVFSFVSNPEPAWACPGFVIGDQQLYLSERIEALGSDVPRTVTFTIAEPSPLDCAVVTVIDDAGNPLPTAGLFVCAHAQGSADCIGSPFEGADGDGVIRMKIDANLVYDLGTFIANAGWPCPGFTASDGTMFHFGESGSFTAGDFLNGVTLVIPVPKLSDCTPGTVTVTDDSGNMLSTAGLFVCAHEPGNSACVGGTFDSADPDGIIRILIDPALIYDLRPTISNTGWLCPSFIGSDGTTFHHGKTVSFTADELLAGVTMVITQPTPETCVVMAVTDDSGNPLPTAGLFVCAHLPEGECVGDPFEGPDPDGIIRMAVDPDLLYDLGAFIANSGWPCPGFVSDDGTTFHFSPNDTYSPDQLRAGVTFVIAVPSPEDCAT